MQAQRIPAGRYICRARPESLIFGAASTNAPQVAIELDIMNEGFEGETIGWYGVLTGGATEITLRELRAAGWLGQDFNDPHGLGSVEVEAVIKYEPKPGDGKLRMKVELYPSGGSRVKMEKPIQGAELRALSASLKGEILASMKHAPPARKATATAASGPSRGPGGWDGQGADPNDDGRVF
jgi:hypothetical protein